MNMANSDPNTEPITIIWKEYSKVLRAGIWSLFKEQLLVDVSLTRDQSEGHKEGFKVHRFILAVFFNGLKDPLIENNRNQQQINQIHHLNLLPLLSSSNNTNENEDVLKVLMEFAYSGTVTVPRHSLENVLLAAQQLGFEGLVNCIKEHDINYTSASFGETDENDAILADVVDFCDSDNVFEQICSDSFELTTLRNDIPTCVSTEAAPNEVATAAVVGEVINVERQSLLNASDVLRLIDGQSRHEDVKKDNFYADSLENDNDDKLKEGKREENDELQMLSNTSDVLRLIDGQSLHHETKKDSYYSDLSESKDEDKVKEGKIENGQLQTLSNASDVLRLIDRQSRHQETKKIICYSDSSDDKDDDKLKEGKSEENDDKSNKTTVLQHKAKRKRPAQSQKKRLRARYTCDRCDYSTSDKPSYQNHLVKHDPSVEVQIFPCTLCGKEFRSKNGYLCHAKTHGNGEFLYNCDLCPFRTPQKWSYCQHMAVLHKLDENGKPLTEKIACDQCDFVCVATYQLKSHKLRKHTSEKPYKCNECDHSTKTKGDLNNHIQVRHCKERPFMCDTCGFRCQTQSLLNRHRLTHSGVKPFKCQLCGMEYATSQKYKYHIERHKSDEKPFVCHICGHSSRRKDNLKMHLKRVHRVNDTDTDNLSSGLESGSCVTVVQNIEMIVTTTSEET